MMIRAGNEFYSSVLGPDVGTHAARALSCGPTFPKSHLPPSFLHPLKLGAQASAEILSLLWQGMVGSQSQAASGELPGDPC